MGQVEGPEGWPGGQRRRRCKMDAFRFSVAVIPRLSLAHFSSPFYPSPFPPFSPPFPPCPAPLMDPIYLDGSSTSAPYDQIEIDDEEEDQLASDIDENEQQPQTARAPDGEELEPDPEEEDAARDGGQPQSSTAPNGKRKHQRKSAERVPGHTLLPATRLENILRADGMRPCQMMSCPPSSPQSFRREWSNVERGTVCFVDRNSTSLDVAILTLG
jgi:hypothetical protein